MDLYLIRHADALPLGEDTVIEDAERPLSETGKAQCRDLAAALQRQGVRLETVLTSPLLRARQTADEMLKHWQEPLPQLQVCDELDLGGKRQRLVKAVEELKKGAVALVGHQPELSELGAWLIGSRKVRLDLAKAGVAFIPCAAELDKGAGTLGWLVTPGWYKTS